MTTLTQESFPGNSKEDALNKMLFLDPNVFTDQEKANKDALYCKQIGSPLHMEQLSKARVKQFTHDVDTISYIGNSKKLEGFFSQAQTYMESTLLTAHNTNFLREGQLNDLQYISHHSIGDLQASQIT